MPSRKTLEINRTPPHICPHTYTDLHTGEHEDIHDFITLTQKEREKEIERDPGEGPCDMDALSNTHPF